MPHTVEHMIWILEFWLHKKVYFSIQFIFMKYHLWWMKQSRRKMTLDTSNVFWWASSRTLIFPQTSEDETTVFSSCFLTKLWLKRPGLRKVAHKKLITVLQNSSSFLSLHVPFLFLTSVSKDLPIFRAAVPVLYMSC